MNPLPDSFVDHYLRTGECDTTSFAGPGENLVVSAARGRTVLLNALIADIRARSQRSIPSIVRADLNLVRFTRAKVAPMVSGLFPAHEQACVLAVLEKAIVVLTPANIEVVLSSVRYLGTAWTLANLYLASVDAPLLSDEAPHIIGLSEETTCYVSANYFNEVQRFDDVIVHEAAHIFHNCKRKTIGLPETRSREWLLDIDFAKRETFAYACEAYSRLLTLGRSRAERTRLLGELAQTPPLADDRVDVDEYLDILREAVGSRNGWKRILQRCAPLKPSRARTNLSDVTNVTHATSGD